MFEEQAVLSSKVIAGKDDDPAAAKYKDYFDWSEPLAKAPSHRVLAIRRGAKEGYLIFHAMPDEAVAIGQLKRRFVKGQTPAAAEVAAACEDCYKRLLSLSMETEVRLSSKKRADDEAIVVFADNLRELLLASPLGSKAVLGVDPGLRTGCKIVCLDRQGKLKHNCTIYPLAPANRTAEAEAMLKALVQQFEIEAIAVGNGTGGRETEAFCRSIDFGRKVPVVMVNESGASVYSASQVAARGIPRLRPDRARIGLDRPAADGPAGRAGQARPEVHRRRPVPARRGPEGPQALARRRGDQLRQRRRRGSQHRQQATAALRLGALGENRRQRGGLPRRERRVRLRGKQLLKVAGMGPKTFEQAAGFLRIRDAENPLDASAVHPESYGVVEKMAADAGCTVADLVHDADRRSRIDLKKYVTETVGMPTLMDILAELAKPGRDPRKQFEAFSFAEGVSDIADVRPGMKLPGIVTNVTAFGAFVDIGVHQDGLVHISQLADKFIERPADVVKVHQKVTVTVLEVDLPRKRISLSMRSDAGQPKPDRGAPDQRKSQPKRGGQSRPPQGNRQQNRQREDRTPTDRNNPFGDLLKKWKQ